MQEATPDPAFHRAERDTVAGGQFGIGIALEEGDPDIGLLVLAQGFQAELDLATLAMGFEVFGDGLGCRPLGQAVERLVTMLGATSIDGLVSRQGRHPGQGAGTCGVKGTGLEPDGGIGLLQDLFRLRTVSHVVQADAEQPARGHAVERFEGQAIALAAGLQQDIERDGLGIGFRAGQYG